MRGLSVTIHQHPLFAYRVRAAVSTTEQVTGVRFKESAMYCLYVVECQGYVKIGITNDLKERLTHFRTGNPFPITVKNVFHFQNRQGAVYLESFFHKALDSWRFSGEWFNVPADFFDEYERAFNEQKT